MRNYNGARVVFMLRRTAPRFGPARHPTWCCMFKVPTGPVIAFSKSFRPQWPAPAQGSRTVRTTGTWGDLLLVVGLTLTYHHPRGRNEVASFNTASGENIWRARYTPPGRGLLKTVAGIAARAASLYFRYGGTVSTAFRGVQLARVATSLRWSSSRSGDTSHGT